MIFYNFGRTEPDDLPGGSHLSGLSNFVETAMLLFAVAVVVAVVAVVSLFVVVVLLSFDESDNGVIVEHVELRLLVSI